MLRRLKIRGFKSLRDVSIEFPKLTVLFGPNAAGKSNVLDAILLLSRIGTQRTLLDAFSYMRGYHVEAFSFPPGGLPELLKSKPSFSLEADVSLAKERYRYRIGVEMDPRSGALAVQDEYLCDMSADWQPRGNARIERMDNHLTIRRRGGGGKPREEEIGQNYSILSDTRWTFPSYAAMEKLREEFNGWRSYYLDPRNAMRWSQPPRAVLDIGTFGEFLPAFLYHLKAERPKHFDAVRRTLRSIVSSVDDLSVSLDERQGTLDIMVTQGGTEFSSRILSEGTLRVLALCAIAVNPWSAPLLAFEEPENGVHPRRIELIADLLYTVASGSDRQIVVTTHSPLFCDALLRRVAGTKERKILGILGVRSEESDTRIVQLDVDGPLFKDVELRKALSSGSEDGLFEGLMLRGLLDG